MTENESVKQVFSRKGLIRALLIVAAIAAGTAGIRKWTAGSPVPQDGETDGDFLLLNTAPEVKYTGSESCQPCHAEIYAAYRQTRTGRSMSRMDSTNVIESFPQKEPVYDPDGNFYYEMVRKDGRFFQREYRLDSDGEVVHERWMEAQYVIGSGANLRMYFYNDHGMFYQLPLTWYVHKNRWDLSPGYREFNNVRFSRFVSPLCFSCHNGHMELLKTANDRYQAPSHLGVGCESCHGPGDLHVRQENGEKFNLPSENAMTIVNPVRLSPQRRVDVCQQCHLEGQARALHQGKTWFDFRPGMLLAGQRSIYSPGTPRKETFRVANTAYRLRQSRCFNGSHQAMSCDLCHDSHGMIQTSRVAFNRQNCHKCHAAESLPGKTAKFAHSENDDCVSCHMNQTGTENTLHGVINTDHWIRIDASKDPIDWKPLREIKESDPVAPLLPDVDAGDENSDVRKGMAYFEFWTERVVQTAYLDSAKSYLLKGLRHSKGHATGLCFLGQVYLKEGDAGNAISVLEKAVKIRPDYADAHFHLGEAYRAEASLDAAIESFRKAVALKPDEPNYLENLGTALAKKGDTEGAIDALKTALTKDQQNPYTYYALGNLYVQQESQPEKALGYFREAVTLDPDIPNGYLNLGNTLTLLGKYEDAVKAYRKEHLFQPKSANALVNLGRVYTLMGKTDEARKALQQALATDPTMTVARQYLSALPK